MRCPICDKTFEPSDSTALPFCSDRCRTIDLSRWLEEAYRMPLESVPQSGEDTADEDAGPSEGRTCSAP